MVLLIQYLLGSFNQSAIVGSTDLLGNIAAVGVWNGMTPTFGNL